MSNALQEFPQQQQQVTVKRDFLIQNWKKILAKNAQTNLAKVRILNGVASIFSQKMIIRCPVTLNDGFYILTAQDQFKQIHPANQIPHTISFPDIGCFEPQFSHYPPILSLSLIQVRQLIDFCEKASENNVSNIWVHAKGFGYADGRGEKFYFNTPIQLIQGQTFKVNTDIFKLALIELMRYDCINMFYDPILRSLVFGKSWTSCVLISCENSFAHSGGYQLG